jgi:O-antigen ligase
VALPLAVDTASLRPFVGPKLLIALLLGSLAAAALLAWGGAARLGRAMLVAFGAHAVTLVAATALSLQPGVSLAGDTWRGMGLGTRLSLVALALAAGSAAAADRRSLVWMLRAVAAACAVAAAYALAQALRLDPLFDPALLEHTSRAGVTELRPVSTLGHANFAGHLMLFGTGAAVALAGLERAATHRGAAAAAGLLACVGVVVSGSRGAWVALAVQAVTGAALALPAFGRPRAARLGVAAAGLVVALGISLAVARGPLAEQLVARAAAFRADNLTGSGRTILWRDALPMVGTYWAHGTGPEVFALAFLPYQSAALTRAEPYALYDSSHNVLLDAAIATGIAGAAALVALFAAAASALVAAWRRAAAGPGRALPLGLGLGLLGYAVHGFFVFDTIATAFYFYLFVALAAAAGSAGPGPPTFAPRWRAAAAALLVITAAAGLWPRLWYVWRSDRQMALAHELSSRGDLAPAIANARAAIENGAALGPVPELRRLLVRIYARAGDPSRPPGGAERQLLEEGRAEAERALGASTSPHLLLVEEADLAARLGDLDGAVEALRRAAAVAPAFWYARVRLAELLLARGEPAAARAEAVRALELNPESEAARAALRAAGGDG